MQQLSLARQQDGVKDTYIQTLEQQLNQLKQRYEVLAKQYAQLRKEHLDLLGKLKTLQQSENTLKQKYLLEVEAAKAEARVINSNVLFFSIYRVYQEIRVFFNNYYVSLIG